MRSRLLSTLSILLLVACSRATGLPWEVDAVRVYAPLPGADVSVAYLSIRNRGDAALDIVAAESPQFAQVDFHESSLEDGVARMRHVDRLLVPPHGTLDLAPGGLHLMLQDQTQPLAPGDTVTLVLRVSSGASIEISTRVREREN